MISSKERRDSMSIYVLGKKEHSRALSNSARCIHICSPLLYQRPIILSNYLYKGFKISNNAIGLFYEFNTENAPSSRSNLSSPARGAPRTSSNASTSNRSGNKMRNCLGPYSLPFIRGQTRDLSRESLATPLRPRRTPEDPKLGGAVRNLIITTSPLRNIRVGKDVHHQKRMRHSLEWNKNRYRDERPRPLPRARRVRGRPHMAVRQATNPRSLPTRCCSCRSCRGHVGRRHSARPRPGCLHHQRPRQEARDIPETSPLAPSLLPGLLSPVEAWLSTASALSAARTGAASSRPTSEAPPRA